MATRNERRSGKKASKVAKNFNNPKAVKPANSVAANVLKQASNVRGKR